VWLARSPSGYMDRGTAVGRQSLMPAGRRGVRGSCCGRDPDSVATSVTDREECVKRTDGDVMPCPLRKPGRSGLHFSGRVAGVTPTPGGGVSIMRSQGGPSFCKALGGFLYVIA